MTSILTSVDETTIHLVRDLDTNTGDVVLKTTMVSAYSCTSVQFQFPACSNKSCLFLYIDAQFSLWMADFGRDGVGFMPHHSISGYGTIMKLKMRPMQFCTPLAVSSTSAE